MLDSQAVKEAKAAIYDLLYSNCNEAITVSEIIFDHHQRPVDYIILEANPSFEIHSGLSREQIIGRPATEYLSSIEEAWVEKYGQVVLSAQPLKFESYNPALDRWFDVQAFPLDSRSKFVTVFSDITEPRGTRGTLTVSEARRLEQETLAFQAQILANIQDAVIVVDEQDIITYCNKAFEKLFGWTEEELLRQPYHIFVNSHISNESQEAAYSLSKHCKNGCGTEEDRVQEMCFSKDGRSIMVDVSRTVLRGSQGEYKGIISSIRDITQRHEIELALQESEKKYRELVLYAPAAICEVDFHQERYIAVNDVMCKYVGYSREELLTMSFIDLHDEASQALMRSRIDQWLNGQEPDPDVVYVFNSSDGRKIHSSLHLSYTCDDEGNPLGATVIAHDITALKQAEQQLQIACEALEEKVQDRTRELNRERQRLLDVLETLPVIICLWTEDYHVAFANRAFRDRFGDYKQRYCYEHLFGFDKPCEFCETYRVLETGQPHHWQFKGPDGSFFEVYNYPFIDSDGTSLILEMDVELTEKQRTHEALLRSEERFSKIFANSPVVMGIADVEHHFVEVNDALIKAFGCTREEVLGRTAKELNIWVQPGKLLERIDEWESKGQLHNYEVLFRGADGEEHTGLGNTELISIGEADFYLHTMVDVTHQKQIEAELSRLDRLNLIGEMAAGIGHEIRNPLTAVRGFLQMLGAKEEFASHKAYFELMIEELDRANAIISEYLAMAKNKRVDLLPHSLDELISALYPIIVSEANLREMAVKLDLNQPPPALVDQNEFRQLVFNMTHNGLDAMTPQGTLIIGTRLEGRQAVLYIKDEGHGMSPEILNKLGTPFVTSKDTGTGLGLAVCYSIAARHNAVIDYETGPSGTTFYIRFPCA